MCNIDTVIISGLRLFAYHGVNASEKENGQPFELDVSLSADLSAACLSDQLADTVNYAAVVKLVSAVFCAEKNDLIERAAERVATALLDTFPVSAVTVKVKKPEAPITADFDYVGVEITRMRMV